MRLLNRLPRTLYALGAILILVAGAPSAAKDDVALRRKCANLVKVKLNIKETGSVDDLKGVRGAVQMVDRCVANGGKL